MATWTGATHMTRTWPPRIWQPFISIEVPPIASARPHTALEALGNPRAPWAPPVTAEIQEATRKCKFGLRGPKATSPPKRPWPPRNKRPILLFTPICFYILPPFFCLPNSASTEDTRKCRSTKDPIFCRSQPYFYKGHPLL